MGKTFSKAEQAVLDSLPDEAKSLFAEINKAHEDEITEILDSIPEPDAGKTLLEKADPEIRRMIEKSEKDAAEAREIAKAERDLRVQGEMIAKAKNYEHIAGTPEEKAEILKAAYDISDEYGKKIENSWKAANAQLDEAANGMFKPIGKDSGGEEASELRSKVSELRKADPTLTPEKAMDRVLSENPGLYDRYLRGERL